MEGDACGCVWSFVVNAPMMMNAPVIRADLRSPAFRATCYCASWVCHESPPWVIPPLHKVWHTRRGLSSRGLPARAWRSLDSGTESIFAALILGSSQKTLDFCREVCKTYLMEITVKEIESIRKLLGMTQEELADKLGLHRNTIINWERGVGRPSLLHKREIVRLLAEAGG